jgi:hypothetical protein
MAIKSDIEWTRDIIKITTKFRSKFPELIKNIDNPEWPEWVKCF